MALTQEQIDQMALLSGRRSSPSATEQADDPWRSEGAWGDTAVGLAAGALQLPKIAAGVGDMAAAPFGADRPFSRAGSAMADITGFSPSETAERMQAERYSPQMLESRGNVDAAWEGAGSQWDSGDRMGAVGSVAKAYLQNPRAIQATVVESLPMTVAGGLAGRGLAAAAGTRTVGGVAPMAGRTRLPGPPTAPTQVARLSPAAAGAVGEGAVIAGSVMSEIDQSVDPKIAALAALGAGVGGIAFGYGGAKLAQRAGLVDPETALAGGFNAGVREAGTAGKRNIASRVAGGAVSEGILQEAPQESLETIAQNWAEGKPLLENVPRAAVEGMLAGGVLGGVVNIRATRATDLTQPPPKPTTGGPGDTPDTGGLTQDLGKLLSAHKRLTTIARDATQYPDLQERALAGLEQIVSTLEERGIPAAVVDLELAKSRYGDMQLQSSQLLKAYNETLATNPVKARGYLEKMRSLEEETQQLLGVYSEEDLTSPDLAVIQELQRAPGGEAYLKTNGQLNKSAANRFEQYKGMDDETLARQVAKDLENDANGAELDKYAPMRAVVARLRGITEEYISSVTESDKRAGQPAATGAVQTAVPAEGDGAGDTITRTDAAGNTNIIPVDDVRMSWDEQPLPENTPRVAWDKLSAADKQAFAQYVVSENATPEGAAQLIGQLSVTAAMTEEQRAKWAAIQQVVSEFQAGISVASPVARAAEIAGVSRQAMEKAMPNISRRVAAASGRDPAQAAKLSPQKFMDALLSAGTTQDQGTEQAAAPDTAVQEALGDVDAGATDAGTDFTTADEVFDDRGDYTPESLSDDAIMQEVLGGGATTIANAGSSISDWQAKRATNEAADRALEQMDEPTRAAASAALDQVAQEEATGFTEQDNAVRMAEIEAENAALAEEAATRRLATNTALIRARNGINAGRTWEGLAPDGAPRWREVVRADVNTAGWWISEYLAIIEADLTDDGKIAELARVQAEITAELNLEGAQDGQRETPTTPGTPADDTGRAPGDGQAVAPGGTGAVAAEPRAAGGAAPAGPDASNPATEVQQDPEAAAGSESAPDVTPETGAQAGRTVTVKTKGRRKAADLKPAQAAPDLTPEAIAQAQEVAEAVSEAFGLPVVEAAPAAETTPAAKPAAKTKKSYTKSGVTKDETAGLLTYQNQGFPTKSSATKFIKNHMGDPTGERYISVGYKDGTFAILDLQDVNTALNNAFPGVGLGEQAGEATDTQDNSALDHVTNLDDFDINLDVFDSDASANNSWRFRGRVERLKNAEEAGGVESVQTLFDELEQILPTKYMPILEAIRGHALLPTLRFQMHMDGINRRGRIERGGQYNGAYHVLSIESWQISEALEMGFIDPATADQYFAEIILHELLHATSKATIDRADRMPADIKRGVADLEFIAERLRALAATGALDTSPDLKRYVVAAGENAHEVLAYGLSNPILQDFLAGIPAPASRSGLRTLWDTFTSAVAGLFGRASDQNFVSVLDMVLSASDNILAYSDIHTRDTAQIITESQYGDMLQDVMDVRPQLALLGNTQIRGIEASVFLERLDTAVMRFDAAVDTANEQLAANELWDATIYASRALGAYASQGATADSIGATNDHAGMPRPNERSRARRAIVGENYDKSIQQLGGTAGNFLKGLKGRVKELGYLTMFSSDFVDAVKKYLPNVDRYYNTIFHRMSERNNEHVAIQKIVEPVAGWDSARREAINKFLAKSTVEGKWGFKPTWLKNAKYDKDSPIAREFQRLDEDQQRVAIAMFEHAYRIHKNMQLMLRQDIEHTYDELIQRATKDKTIERLEKEKTKALTAHDHRQNAFRDAYLPLKRWGEWAVIYKSERLKLAEKKGTDQKLVDKLKADPKHYRVSFADSEFQALGIRDSWRADGIEADDPFPRQRMEQNNELIPFDLLQRLKEQAKVESDGMGSPAVENALDKLYIQALAENSVRKSELQRIGVSGFSEDMVGAFIEHGQGIASLTSALQINKETRAELQKMKTYARELRGADRTEGMRALNEVLARHAQSLDYNPDPLTGKIMAGTSVWMLLTSPAYYIQNATQPFMLTYPILAGRFGTIKAMGVMTKHYKTILDAYRSTKDGELVDPAKIGGQYADDLNVRALFDSLQRRGLLDVGIAADLGSIRERTGLGRVAGTAHRKMVTAVRTVEVFNRGVSALAAYELELAKQRKLGRPETVAQEAAKAYAHQVVQTTQGDYSLQNAPRLITKIPAGRLVTQFRKFQLIQIGMLVRLVHGSFGKKPTTAEGIAERAIARRQLAYILTMHGLIGGAMGLPAANIIAYALAKAFGDDDEPDNAELLARRYIGDKGVADLILRGLPAWAGMDVSNQLGMGLTFSILPFTDVKASRDGMLVALGSLLGPTAGLGAKMADGLGNIADGNMMYGIGQLLPKGLTNLMRAAEQHTLGVRTRGGLQALSPEELDVFDFITQAVGWPSKTITDRFMVTGFKRETEEFFRDRTGKLKRAYTEARADGDTAGMQQAREEWVRLQASRKAYGIGAPQSLSELVKAPLERAKQERGFVRGVETSSTDRRFVDSLFE